MRYVALIFACLLIVVGRPASADIYTYYPSTTLRLGGGFDPLDTTKVKAGCFDFDDETTVDGLGGEAVSSDTHFTIKQVTSSRELHTLLKTSLSLAGHYEMFSADGSTNSTSEVDMLGSSTSWVLLANADYGRYRAKNIRLNTAATALIKDLPSLIERCGTDVVIQIKRGVSLAIIFTLSNTAQTRDDTLNQKFNASIGGDMWGINASGSLDSSLREAIKHGELMLNVVATGGKGVPGLADLITELKNQNTVAATKIVLAAFAKRLGPEQAAITEYQTGSLTAFIPGLKVPTFTMYNELIGEYTLALNQNLLWLSRLTAYLGGYDSVSSEQKNKVQSAFENVRARTFDITSEALNCRKKYETIIQMVASKQVKNLAAQVPDLEDFLQTLQDQQRSELAQARINSDESRKVINLLSDSPFMKTIEKPKSASKKSDDNSKSDILKPCQFHPVWLDFTEYVNLPQYPFDDPEVWVDNLDQGSIQYQYIMVKGTAIRSAKLVNRQTGAILNSFEKNGISFDILREYSMGEAATLGILVSTKSGRDFTIPVDN